MENSVNHPAHYGGKDNVYEAIKVIEAHGLGFSLGNAVKYILRAGKKGVAVEDLKKAAFYINREIERLSARQPRPAEKMETPTDGLKIKEGDSGPLTPQQMRKIFRETGVLPPKDADCILCNGEGRRVFPNTKPPINQECPACNGSGRALGGVQYIDRQTRGWTRLVEGDPSTYPDEKRPVVWLCNKEGGGQTTVLLLPGDPYPMGLHNTHWIYLPE